MPNTQMPDRFRGPRAAELRELILCQFGSLDWYEITGAMSAAIEYGAADRLAVRNIAGYRRQVRCAGKISSE